MLRGFTSLKYPEKSRQVMKLWLHEKEWERKPVQVAELQLNQGVDCWRRKRKIQALGSEVLGEYDKLAHTVRLLQH